MVTRIRCADHAAHFGCLNAASEPNCRMCAQRLTNAVNYVLHPGVNDTDAARTWTASHAVSAAEALEENGEHTFYGGS